MAQSATPRPAATVVLVRPRADGRFETYINRRPEGMEAYGGVCVFPGGRVEEGDLTPAMLNLARGITGGEAKQKLGVDWPPEVCLSYWVAAARELFEEAGIHFFLPESGAGAPMSQEGVQRLIAQRARLQSGKIQLAELLAEEGLYCNLSALSYFFHRVTPEHYPMRFDTRFFLAILPRDQIPLPTSEEVSESFWIAPDVALAKAAAGEFKMMPPTLAVLRTLDEQSTWANLRMAFSLLPV